MSSHSRLPPSDAKGWMLCPGKIRLIDSLPAEMKDITSSFALEGTAVHQMAYAIEHKNFVPQVGTMFEWDEDEIHFQHEIDQDMIDGALLYLDAIHQWTPPGEKSRMETKLDLSFVHPDLGGTADFFSLVDKTLHVADLKYGKGILVEAAHNQQLMTYAIGALKVVWLEEKAKGRKYPMKDLVECISLHIIQPRAYHPEGPIRTWDISYDDLSWWVTQILHPCAKATDDPEAKLRAGMHCRFCKALPVCSEYANKNHALMKQEFGQSVLPPDPRDMTVEHIIKVMKLSETCSAWMDSVKAYAQTRAELGEKIPGFKLVEKITHRKWGAHEDEIASVVVPILGDQAYAPTKFLTPSQMEKALKKAKVDPEVLDPLIVSPPGGLDLVPESDKRKEVISNSTTDLLEGTELFQ